MVYPKIPRDFGDDAKVEFADAFPELPRHTTEHALRMLKNPADKEKK